MNLPGGVRYIGYTATIWHAKDIMPFTCIMSPTRGELQRPEIAILKEQRLKHTRMLMNYTVSTKRNLVMKF